MSEVMTNAEIEATLNAIKEKNEAEYYKDNWADFVNKIGKSKELIQKEITEKIKDIDVSIPILIDVKGVTFDDTSYCIKLCFCDFIDYFFIKEQKEITFIKNGSNKFFYDSELGENHLKDLKNNIDFIEKNITNINNILVEYLKGV